MWPNSSVLLLVSTILFLNGIISADVIVLNTQNGQVRGTLNQTVPGGNPYYAIRGIPYAEPPVGELRFANPVPKAPWTGIVDGTQDMPICAQGNAPIVGSEDCLYVSVYTTTVPHSNGACAQTLPTYVWIHGGGFQGGNATYVAHGPDNLLDQNMVVVTLHYRLGALGFASTGDQVLPGNLGLKDQQLAMKWVKDNIGSFCGNSNKITLGGQSAGSASVAYHLQSTRSIQYFNQAIMESGLTLNVWALSLNVSGYTGQVALLVGAYSLDSQTLVGNLKQVSLSDLQNAVATVNTAYILAHSGESTPFGPVLEPQNPNAIATERSWQLLATNQSYPPNIPILLGHNTLEGYVQLDPPIRAYFGFYDVNTLGLSPDLNAPVREAIASLKIRQFYFPNTFMSTSTDKLWQFLSDDLFVRPIRQYAKLVYNKAPVYYYRFSYEGGLFGLYNRTFPGTVHSEEIFYYWRTYYAPERPQDLVVQKRVITLWSSFIKTGNPTPADNAESSATLQNIQWPTTDGAFTFLDIGDNLSIQTNPEQANMTFWDSIYSRYGQPPFSTY